MWNYLKTISKPILLYGMGNCADRILDKCYALNIPISGVFASDEFVRGQSFRGYTVMTYAAAKERFVNMVVLLAFGSQLPDVMARIRAIAAEQELYAPDFPVVGDVLFTRDFANNHKTELEWVYSLLADDISKNVFECICRYKLSGNISYLSKCETPVHEAYTNILNLGKCETYMDLGAYRGDTVQEFIKFTNDYNKIIAVEPDVHSFKKLLESTASMKNITAVNAPISDKVGETLFSMQKGRSSKISSKGTFVHAESIDHILSGSAVTFIKMDIEGMENQAITGGAESIAAYKPRMCISAYHRNEDLFEIPRNVLKIRPDYKVYMRHFPYFPSWDVNYYFI